MFSTPTLLTIIGFLYLTGFLIGRALPVAALSNDGLERHFERVCIGALLNGWLALVLAQLGFFSLLLHLALLATLAIVAHLIARRRSVVRVPDPNVHRSPFTVQPSTFHAITLAAILGVFVFLVGRPFETVIGVRDAGVYANAGFALARGGSLAIHDPLVAQIATDQQSPDRELADAARQAETNFLGTQNPQRFIATRLRAAGFFINQDELDDGRVVPQGLHLFTAWIGLLTSAFGLAGGMLAPGVLGVLGVWGVAMLGRRLAGPWGGLLAALLLALNAVQVWFSRYSTTETTAQFLIIAGLYAFAAHHPASDAERSALNMQRPTFAALLAGIAFGQLALTRIEFFLVLGPVFLYLLFAAVARRWNRTHTTLLAGSGVMLLHAALQVGQIARAYFFDTLFARLQDFALTAALALPFLTPALRQVYLLRPCSRLTIQPCPPVAGMPPTTEAPWNWPRIGAELLVVTLLVIALLAARRFNLPDRLAPAARRLATPLRMVAAVAVIALGLYAYLIRPQILSPQILAAAPSCLAPAQLAHPDGPCLHLQGYIGAPIAVPGYVDPLAAWLDRIAGMALGRATPALESCVALRGELLPAAATGRTTPELIRDGLLNETAVPPGTLATLRACDRYVLRDLFGNAQASLVRVGWYISPLGIALAIGGLALMTRRADAASWLFLAVTAIASLVFLRLTYGAGDQHYIYILRRYIPHVYPAFAIGAAYALVALGSRFQHSTPHVPRPAFHVPPSTFHLPPSTFFVPRSTFHLPPSTFHLPRSSFHVLRSTFHVLRSTFHLPRSSFHLQRATSIALTIALIAFLIVTGWPIYRHTEYAGAIDQLGVIAARFEPGAIVLLRGGAPTYAQARDVPDLIATPLTFAFGVDAFALKSRDPGRYATQLARYIRHWHDQGRPIYLALSASGAVSLPGLRLEPAGRLTVDVPEFEQLTDQKPSNVQRFTLDFALYRALPGEPPERAPYTIAPDDYAYQIRGIYRAERIDGRTVAWTDGDALLRLPVSASPATIQITLAAGERPTALGPVTTCLALAAEPGFSTDDIAGASFTQPVCATLGPKPETLSLSTGALPSSSTGAIVLRIYSATWIPARDDPQGRDPRRLGVQIVSITMN